MQGGSSVGQFLYDARGLRVEKLGNRGLERYTYDEQSVLAQLDSTNQPIAHYDYGPGRLMALTHRDEGTAFYHFDALGSIVNLTTTAGAVQTRTLYDAWGHHRLQEGDSWNRFGFTGHEEDPETGLVYAKARFYDPDVGRFLSMDAWEGDLTLAPSLHKYLYAYGNPLVWVDPDGKQGYPATTYTAEKEKEAQERKAEEDALYAQSTQDSDHGAFTEESTIGGLPGWYLFYSRSMNAAFGPGGHYIDPMIRSAGKEEYASYVSWKGGYTNKFVKVFTPVAAGLLLSRMAMKNKIVTEGGDVSRYSPRIPSELPPASSLEIDLTNPLAKLNSSKVVTTTITYTPNSSGGFSGTVDANSLASVGTKYYNNFLGKVEKSVGGVQPITDPGRLLPAPKNLTPEMPGKPIVSEVLPEGYVFNQAVSPRQPNPGKFGTDDYIPDVNYVRNELAVIPSFKGEVSGVRQVVTTRPVRVQRSTVGPQKEDGVTYPGGGSQIDVLEYDPLNPFVKFVDGERAIE
ncbi:RHS repeat domain-containing protein [Zooshikella ganghwensis]|uniref:RHS repeat-associated core domain-containing protein n=1 Tax=Zooshikella ganghwensis TaxID=202772 RepID=A0A4V1INQ4_9GAMM|nr:RHS repeat-associated core domain-containing protein [Zooshikella ganghwensis]RDH44541.1 RHS repeat-associated core domain-containing protein [Zooshikella ganghwensis]